MSFGRPWSCDSVKASSVVDDRRGVQGRGGMVTEAINLMDTQRAWTGVSGPGDGGSELTAVGLDSELLDAQDVELSWQERALCAQTDPEAFFPEKGGSTREAKKVCLGCDVRGECLEYALAHDERFGIWGGLSERERRRLKKEAV
jgi:WhiB family transcriptional regulator, redox-sensing transcriptional regulator